MGCVANVQYLIITKRTKFAGSDIKLQLNKVLTNTSILGYVGCYQENSKFEENNCSFFFDLQCLS